METDHDISMKEAIYFTAGKTLMQLPSEQLASPAKTQDTLPGNAGWLTGINISYEDSRWESGEVKYSRTHKWRECYAERR